MPNETDATETTESFLKALGESLAKTETFDCALTEILCKHILTTSPAKDAVSSAKVQIIKLANDRATPPTAEAVNG